MLADQFLFYRALFTSQEAVEDDPFLGTTLLEQVKEWHWGMKTCALLADCFCVFVVFFVCFFQSWHIKCPKTISFHLNFRLNDFVYSFTLGREKLCMLKIPCLPFSRTLKEGLMTDGIETCRYSIKLV